MQVVIAAVVDGEYSPIGYNCPLALQMITGSDPYLTISSQSCPENEMLSR